MTPRTGTTMRRVATERGGECETCAPSWGDDDGWTFIHEWASEGARTDAVRCEKRNRLIVFTRGGAREGRDRNLLGFLTKGKVYGDCVTGGQRTDLGFHVDDFNGHQNEDMRRNVSHRKRERAKSAVAVFVFVRFLIRWVSVSPPLGSSSYALPRKTAGILSLFRHYRLAVFNW